MIKAESKTELVKLLCERYGITENTVYTRLRKLEMKETKQDGILFLSDEQIQTLDELDLYLKTDDRASIASFITQQCTDVLPSEVQSPEYSSNHSPFSHSFTSDGTANQIAQLVAIAQQKAGGILIAERALTAKYLANPELLDDELKEQIAHWDEKCLPTSVTAEEFANHLLSELS
ncbi:hypothetical protein [Cyanobacterium aponinum]|uniref:Uncharacterized protein n=1 Tax=Cyanobacterium aponinum 0216 TaxID=2676140 RepID=A0A844GLU9_9CHRO|nr:hypothetical protein [Cyanobacterium aponinum]MTF37554.1 hypothetical protein [Cyanobacterium aponinum 0216]